MQTDFHLVPLVTPAGSSDCSSSRNLTMLARSLVKYAHQKIPTSDTTSLNQGSRLRSSLNQLAVDDCLSFSRLYMTASSHTIVSKASTGALQTPTLKMDASFRNARCEPIEFFDCHSIPFRSTRAFGRNTSCRCKGSAKP